MGELEVVLIVEKEASIEMPPGQIHDIPPPPKIQAEMMWFRF